LAFKKDLVNLKLIIEYDGKNYFGWQRQKTKPSIQETIEQSLQVLFPKEKIKLTGAGRTDTGVSALNQAANFYVSKHSLEKLKPSKLAYQLNAILPDDIAVKKITKVSNDFHARYSAASRVYKYYLSTEKKAVYGDKFYRIKTKFDIDLAKELCKLLVGIHSFKSSCKNKTDEHDFMCDVKYARVKKIKNNLIEFEICANRFLHSMVRAIVGLMLSVASGKVSIIEFKSKFKKGEEIKTQYVPANALFLVKVNY
jgi:tRNA pseudouridine38-40 synthase